MDYPSAVIAKAQQLETLLQRIAAGEPCAAVCADLGLAVTPAELARLQAKYAAGEQRWTALLDGRFGHAQCVNSAMREWLYERKRQDASLRATALAAALAQEFGVQVAAGHINYLLRKVGLSSPPGRPYKPPVSAPTPPAAPPPTPSLANAGLFFLEAAKQEMAVPQAVTPTLATAAAEYQAAQPEATLRLLSSEPATVWHKLDHLLYLPVLGLTRPADLYYYQGAGLRVLYGFTYKYLPLEHFLGQLTRLQIGYPLAAALSRCYSQAWYPGATPLFIPSTGSGQASPTGTISRCGPRPRRTRGR